MLGDSFSGVRVIGRRCDEGSLNVGVYERFIATCEDHDIATPHEAGGSRAW
jgi:hypothetical protein